MSKVLNSSSLREIIFGLEDGMVSTMGVITGIAGGTHDSFTIILAGLVIVSVESLSMAAGTYLSNKTEEEYLANATKIPLHRRLHLRSIEGVKTDALFMGLAYIVGGLFPLIPYFFIPVSSGIPVSILLTVLGLVVVGVGKAKLTNTKPFKSALEMVLVSLSATLVGFVIGKVFSTAFPQLKEVGI
jgi:predicted membrane protein (TIGR00267 family)